MFNVRPNAFWPWLYAKPPSENPPGLDVAGDSSAQDAGARVNGAASTDILFGGRYRPDGDNPFYFPDRRDPQLAEPQKLSPLLQGYNGELSRFDPPLPGFHVEPKAADSPGFNVATEAPVRSGLPDDIGGLTSFEYNPKADIEPYVGTGATVDDSRSPFSFLDRKVSDAGQRAGALNSPYASIFPWSNNLPTPNAQNPAGSGAGTLGGQNPSATLVANPSRSPLLPVGDDRYRYVPSGPEKMDNRELDPFEKLKQRG